MKTVEIKERLLVALYLEAEENGHGRYVDARDIARDFGLDVDIEKFRSICYGLDGADLIQGAFTDGGGPGSGLDMKLTGPGAERAEFILEEHPEYAPTDPAEAPDLTSDLQSKGDMVPASDRYVSVSDNASEFEKLSEHLELIKSELKRDHNFQQLQIDNLAARISDIEIFQKQIEDGHVSRTNALNLRETISYIAGIAKDITAIITAITAVGGLLYILFNLPPIG